MATDRKNPPRKPADHKDPQPRFSDVEGHELLKPFSKVRGSDQARLVARLQAMGVFEDSEDVDLDLNQAADFIDWVAERFAPDVEAFERFTMGPGGLERALNLVVSYAGEQGKDAR